MRPALLLGSALMVASALGVGRDDNLALKASYIYNFALFTNWPAPSAAEHFDVCASPDAPLWDSLHGLSGKTVDDLPWTVIDIGLAATGQCRIVVLSGPAAMPDADTTTGVLVIDDGSASAASAAAITLLQEHDRLRFDVDTRKASDMGLSFSSKLLRLARNVS